MLNKRSNRDGEPCIVAIGGGTNHRFGLYDMIMIKDNHIDYAGGIPQAIQACKTYLKNKREEARAYMEKYWDTHVIANKFKEI